MNTSRNRFDKLREKWNQVLTGGELPDISDEELSLKVQDIDQKAMRHWSCMNKEEDRKCLWNDLTNELKAKNSFESYLRLEQMTVAFCTKGARLENDPALKGDIVKAVEWMYENCYNEKEKLEQEWFFKMGMPLSLNNIVVMLYDNFPENAIKKYMDSVAFFSQDTSYHGISTACNRIWRCMVIVVHGVLTQDSARISFGIDELLDPLGCVFEYVEDGDGYYKDGSFLQHDYFAYNGGYGKDSIHALVHLLFLVHGSQWQIEDRYTKNFFRWIYDSYEPLIYKGQMMDMTRGREISRFHCSSHFAGHFIMQGILLASQIGREADSSAFKSMLKDWLTEGSYADFCKDASMYMLKAAKKIIMDATVLPRGELIFHKHYISMDKTVHARKSYRFGISMFSDRIANFESLNYENLKGWHTGDGMTFLYNDDLTQFDDHYWVTVDCKRLPGITADSGTFLENHPPLWNIGNKKPYLNPNGWTGGTSVSDIYGVCGMDMAAEGCTLTARKSWFMFDEEIVCLGSGIKSTDGRRIETVVENRKVSHRAKIRLSMQDRSKELSQAGNIRSSEVKWAHLDTGMHNTDIGYYFPFGQTMVANYETRKGNWAEINQWYADETPYFRDYISLLFDHGINPANAGYAYVLLPDKSQKEVEDFAAAPSVDILENSSQVHAVRHRHLNIIGANFWEDEVKSIGGITCNRKASLMVLHTQDFIELAVSDPTHKNQHSITVELDIPARGIIKADPRVKVEALSPRIKVKIDVMELKGASTRIQLNK